MQLHGGNGPTEETVEYCINGTWEAVCYNFWDNENAFVVCRQLGFPATSKQLSLTKIYLSAIACMHACLIYQSFHQESQ